MINRILPYFYTYKKYTILSFVMILIEVVTEVIQPLVMAPIIDYGIPNKDFHFIVQQGLIMVGLAIVSLSTGVLGAKFASLAGVGVATDLRMDEMKKIQQFSFKNIDHFSNASLITRLTTDISSVQNTSIMTLRILSRAPLMIIVTICLALRINLELSLILVVALPFLALALALIIAIAFPRFHKLQQAVDGINRTLQENFIGIRVVKSFVREDFEIKKFNQEVKTFKQRALRAINVVIFNNPLMLLTVYACTLSIMWFGGNMTMNGVLTTGELISFISYITQIFMSLMMMSFIFVMMTMTKASLERIFEVMDTPVDIIEKENSQAIKVIDGSVAFEDVHFSYGKEQTEEALNGITFNIAGGKVLGIIGPTGSGKTSLVQLIPRLFDVDKGVVKVGGVDVRDYKFEDLRQHVAMVLQKNTLFTGTIRENLLWGNEFATEDEMIAAAKHAQAHQFIMEMPDGYDTIVEQGGGNFSGGQKQRLCIARAMIRKPKILILDDSTSAVDTATDALIREAFFNHLPQTTVIIIAQRISSIQGADKILVLEDGYMTGMGTHEELMQTNSLYQDIYETQTNFDEKGEFHE